MVDGRVESIKPEAVTGWAKDTDDLSRRLKIKVRIGDETIGETVADVYRPDLFANGHPPGNFGFVARLERPLDGDMINLVTVEALAADKTEILRMWGGHRQAQVRSLGPAPSDRTQYPIFVLGAARSGTSAMGNALRKIPGVGGFDEGHFIELLYSLHETANTFYDVEKRQAVATGSTMVAAVDRTVVHHAIRRAIIDVVKATYDGFTKWVDKTPTSKMILLSSTLIDIWPNAKFIFMKRRFFENLVSRRNKFPSDTFEASVYEWSGAMKAWLQVSDAVRQSAIEVDQFEMNVEPEHTARRVGQFLELASNDVEILSNAFRFDRPESTGGEHLRLLAIDDLELTDIQMRLFRQEIEPVYGKFGYSTGHEVTVHIPPFSRVA